MWFESIWRQFVLKFFFDGVPKEDRQHNQDGTIGYLIRNFKFCLEFKRFWTKFRWNLSKLCWKSWFVKTFGYVFQRKSSSDRIQPNLARETPECSNLIQNQIFGCQKKTFKSILDELYAKIMNFDAILVVLSKTKIMMLKFLIFNCFSSTRLRSDEESG